MPHIAHITFLVRDYDEAIHFFTAKLNFEVVEDVPQGSGKRWVRVRPANSSGPDLILGKAATPQQHAAVGEQAGGRVFLFLQTDDFKRDYDAMKKRGVEFSGEPREESYGTVAVFADLYGSLWDLIQPR